MKPRYKRRIWWGVVVAVAILLFTAVLLPSFITLNELKPQIENEILTRTGVAARINGNVNFSWLGGIQYVANDVEISNGAFERVYFPRDFDTIVLSGGRISVDGLFAPKFPGLIEINDTIVNFKGKDYRITNGELANGMLRGAIVTNQHRYAFDTNGDEFHISNRNENLDISGHIFSDGAAAGRLSIQTRDVNKFFDFKTPHIEGAVELDMDFDWDGNFAFHFSDIRGIYNNSPFTGDIKLTDDLPDIKIQMTDTDIDLTPIMGDRNFYKSFNGHFTGKIKLGSYVFESLTISNDLFVGKMSGKNISCVYSGAPGNWKCSEFEYDDIRGSVGVQNGQFEIFMTGDFNMPNLSDFPFPTNNGVLHFQFRDMAGDMVIDNGKSAPTFRFATSKNLRFARADIEFLPDWMMDTIGDIDWTNDIMTFIPHSKRWTLVVQKNNFVLRGNNIRDLFQNIDLRFINDTEYTVSGTYKNATVSNLKIQMAGHTFDGTFASGNLTLKTNLLNIDTFISQNYLDDIDAQQYRRNEPILTLFSLPNISLSAERIIYNGDEFSEFNYALQNDVMVASITDASRGNILMEIGRGYADKYTVSLVLNKFKIVGNLLTSTALNIADTVITGRADLETRGKIAYDIWHNMSGNIDVTFDGGMLIGLGFDGFYANAKSAGILNAEYMLSAALDGGESALKKLRVTGIYNGGDFETDAPFELSLRHTSAVGMLKIFDGKLTSKINLTLRGTSPEPRPLTLEILPMRRNYSLAEIMRDFDPEYLREFVRTHNRF